MRPDSVFRHISRHQAELMQVQPVHAVDLFADRLIFALAGQNIMIEDCVRESDLILIRHAAQAVGRSLLREPGCMYWRPARRSAAPGRLRTEYSCEDAEAY